MSEEAAPVVAAPEKKATKKSTAVAKAKAPKKVANHPKYTEMIVKAIGELKERNGSSRQAILKYISANYNIQDDKSINAHLRGGLKRALTTGALKQVKGTGASGSFKLAEKAVVPKAKAAAKPKKAAKPAGEKKAKAATPKVKKAAAAAAAKKPKATKPKKATTPKKAVAAAAKPKKPAAPKAKKPAAVKPKKATTPKKAAPKAKKPAAKKAPAKK